MSQPDIRRNIASFQYFACPIRTSLPGEAPCIFQFPSLLSRNNPSYKQWGDKGAFFLTELIDNHGWEWRCYMRDPDGYLIEVGQHTQMALDRFKNYAS